MSPSRYSGSKRMRVILDALKLWLVRPSMAISLAGLLLWPALVLPKCPAQDATCENGNGEYSTRFASGVTVSVGAVRKGAFSERACFAKVFSNTQEIPVASDVAKVDIDVLGADLGFGKPVVAFQIDESGSGFEPVYQIFSLTNPPRLLYTITGGDTYSAADEDLDARVEIWTDDAAGVYGFERLPRKDLDFAPTVVLRFEKNHLIDVSPKFQSHYDVQISNIRAHMDPHDLAEFKQSDGVLSLSIARSNDALHRLIRTKIAVLEIIWSYLYSGRESQAWFALHDMWPASDVERIRAVITNARLHGILQGVDHSSHVPSRKDHAKVYDAIGISYGQSNLNHATGVPGTDNESPIIQPKSILLRRPPPEAGESLSREEQVVELVVDAAGKVRSAKIVQGADKKLVEAASAWHFIPAFRDERPVACRFRLRMWPLQ
jgi:hypothetical protein